jgi:hypothetical protein
VKVATNSRKAQSTWQTKKNPKKMIRGRVVRQITPFQQKVFAGFFKGMLERAYIRTKRVVEDTGPGLALFTAIYYWAQKTRHHEALLERD